MSEHSPFPFSLPLRYENGPWVGGIADAYGRFVIEGPIQSMVAEPIIAAVNNHDKLVEALEWLVNTASGVGMGGDTPPAQVEIENAIENGRQILAALKEESK